MTLPKFLIYFSFGVCEPSTINNFDDKSYMRERKYSVDFISCLEFFLVKKLNDNNSKIENQIGIKYVNVVKK